MISNVRMRDVLASSCHELTSEIFTRLHTAPAARTSVCKVVAALSGLSKRSNCARVVPMRLAIAVLVSYALVMRRSSSYASKRFTAIAWASS